MVSFAGQHEALLTSSCSSIATIGAARGDAQPRNASDNHALQHADEIRPTCSVYRSLPCLMTSNKMCRAIRCYSLPQYAFHEAVERHESSSMGSACQGGQNWFWGYSNHKIDDTCIDQCWASIDIVTVRARSWQPLENPLRFCANRLGLNYLRFDWHIHIHGVPIIRVL